MTLSLLLSYAPKYVDRAYVKGGINQCFVGTVNRNFNVLILTAFICNVFSAATNSKNPVTWFIYFSTCSLPAAHGQSWRESDISLTAKQRQNRAATNKYFHNYSIDRLVYKMSSGRAHTKWRLKIASLFQWKVTKDSLFMTFLAWEMTIIRLSKMFGNQSFFHWPIKYLSNHCSSKPKRDCCKSPSSPPLSPSENMCV